jgi:arsenite methyltransferase
MGRFPFFAHLEVDRKKCKEFWRQLMLGEHAISSLIAQRSAALTGLLRHVTAPLVFLVLVLATLVPVLLTVWPLAPLLSPRFDLGLARADEPKPPERDRWQMPNEVLSALDVKKGDVVADIGAGAGYFTMRFARAVGPEGRVYAVDIAAHVLEYVKKQAQKKDLNNVETIVSREDDPLLPAGSVDLAFFCDTVHEIADRVSFYRKVRQAMKRRGRMAVIDSMVLTRGQGEAAHETGSQVSRDATVREAEKAGFRLVKEPKFLPRQYFLVFERAARGTDARGR